MLVDSPVLPRAFHASPGLFDAVLEKLDVRSKSSDQEQVAGLSFLILFVSFSFLPPHLLTNGHGLFSVSSVTPRPPPLSYQRRIDLEPPLPFFKRTDPLSLKMSIPPPPHHKAERIFFSPATSQSRSFRALRQPFL